MKSSSDNNLDNGDLDKMEALIIDVPLPPSAVFNNKNFKVFFTLFGLVEKKEEMVPPLSIDHLVTLSLPLARFLPMVLTILLTRIVLLTLSPIDTRLINSIEL